MNMPPPRIIDLPAPLPLVKNFFLFFFEIHNLKENDHGDGPFFMMLRKILDYPYFKAFFVSKSNFVIKYLESDYKFYTKSTTFEISNHTLTK